MGKPVTDDDLKKVVELATALESASEDVKKSGEKLMTEMKNLGDASAATKAEVDKALAKHNELAELHKGVVGRITEIEQQLAQKREATEPQATKSIGQRFIEDEKVKSFNSSSRGSVRVALERADITNVTGTVGSGVSPATSLVGSQRLAGFVTPPERQLVIRDLLAPGTTGQGNIEYVQETGFTNAAAIQTEGGTKAQSDLTFDLKNAPVRTIATYFKASRQILDDAPALQSYIDARARYGLRYAEETELLTGDGTGVHIKGLVPSATAFDAAFVPTAQQNIDVIRLAILQVALANFPASGIVLHPTDWTKIQLTKDSQNRYIMGNPESSNVPRLWNLPVVESQSMTATEFLVGAFNLAAQIFDRMEIEVLLSTENDQDFIKNMVTIRAEERLALAIYRPEAIIHGDFDTAT